MRTDALEKVRWYNAPRQIQILNEDPVVKDLRTADQPARTIEIQLAPVPRQAGAAATLSPGGLQIGPANQMVRSAAPGSGPASLPKARLGSNIPARSAGSGASLPKGNSTNMLAGKFASNPIGSGAGASRSGASKPAVARLTKPAAPPIASYSDGYGPVSRSAAGSSAMQTTTAVSAVLKRHSLLSGK